MLLLLHKDCKKTNNTNMFCITLFACQSFSHESKQKLRNLALNFRIVILGKFLKRSSFVINHSEKIFPYLSFWCKSTLKVGRVGLSVNLFPKFVRWTLFYYFKIILCRLENLNHCTLLYVRTKIYQTWQLLL